MSQKAEVDLRKEHSMFIEKSESLKQLVLGLHIQNSDILHAITYLDELQLFINNVYSQRIIILKNIGNN